MRWTVLVVLAAFTASRSQASAQEVLVARPSDHAACGAWSTHVQDLLEQHRSSAEVSDEEFGTAQRLFSEARDACSAGRVREAFDLYSVFPLGRPQRTALR